MVNISSVGIHFVLCFSLGNAFCFNYYKTLWFIHAAITVTMSNANEGSREASLAPTKITVSFVSDLHDRKSWPFKGIQK